MSEIKSKILYDIFVIGGGVNGVAIARDASGRGFSVALAEMNEFAKTADDILWCRTKIGLKIDKVAEKKLKSFLKKDE